MSKLLFNEQPLVIDKKLATLVGVNEAIVLQQINYWIEINRKADKNFYEDKYWTYNTIEEWQEEFPFWSIDTVKRTLTKLRKLNILVTSNFNKLKTDRTLWYTINFDELEKLDEENEERKEKEKNEEKSEAKKEEKSIQPLKNAISAKCTNGENSISAKCPNALVQNAPLHQGILHRPLPEITTEITSEISNQSINQSMKDENIKIKTDRQIDIPTQQMDDYNRIINNCEIGYVDEKYRASVTHAIKLLFWDIIENKRIQIGDNSIPAEIAKKDMEKLNFLVIEHAINKYKEASREREIKNTVAYLKSCIYNSIHEMDLDVDSELRYKGII